MINNKIAELYKNLKSINLKGVTFAYAVAKNIKILQPEVDSLQEALKPSKEYELFEHKRVELAKNSSEKDASGKPIIEKDSYKIEDKELFETKFSALKEEYKEAIEAREKQLDEFNELLEQDTEINLFKVKLSDVPQDISTVQLSSIIDMIEE